MCVFPFRIFFRTKYYLLITRFQLIEKNLEKSFPINTYNKSDLTNLAKWSDGMSHSDIVSNINSTITQQMKFDMQNGHYLKGRFEDEIVYYSCNKDDPEVIHLTTVPEGKLRGKKISLKEFKQNFTSNAVPERSKTRQLIKFGRKHVRF